MIIEKIKRFLKLSANRSNVNSNGEKKAVKTDKQPQEKWVMQSWVDKEVGLPAVAKFNVGLKSFPDKSAFEWQLSLIVSFEDTDKKGHPTLEERGIVEPYLEELSENIAKDQNAMLLGKIHVDSYVQLIFRIHDPEAPHNFLQGIIDKETNIRPFDYQMEHDPDWEWGNSYLDDIN